MTICAVDGALNFVQGGIIGALFGAFGGLSESAQAGLRYRHMSLSYTLAD
jgi:hypothetical protein